MDHVLRVMGFGIALRYIIYIPVGSGGERACQAMVPMVPTRAFSAAAAEYGGEKETAYGALGATNQNSSLGLPGVWRICGYQQASPALSVTAF